MTRRSLGQAIPMSTLVIGILPSLREAEVVAEAEVPKLSDRTICVVGQAPNTALLEVLQRTSHDVRVALNVEDVVPGSIVISLDNARVDIWTADLLGSRTHDAVMEHEFTERFNAGLADAVQATKATKAVKAMGSGMLEASRTLGTITAMAGTVLEAMAGTVLERSAPPEPPMLFENPVASAPFARFHWGPPAQDARERRDAKRKAEKRARKQQRKR